MTADHSIYRSDSKLAEDLALRPLRWEGQISADRNRAVASNPKK